MSTEQVVLILEASAKCGVQVLKFRNLYVKFGKQTEPANLPDSPNTHAAQSSAVAEMTDQQHKKMSDESLEQQELELRFAQIQEALITDPTRFEELVNDGELDEDDANESTDDDPS